MPTLEWIGKEKVINHHQEVPFRVLERKYSFDAKGRHESDIGSENMIIRGDNLEALKALLPKYEGKVKCIYIDPPYNTGTENWVYNDNVNDPKIRKWLGEVVGKEGEDLSRHDKWLCMMYPRLKLLRKLLSIDGVIFVSINDIEVSSLRFMMDDIFGKSAFIAQLIWKSRQNKDNRNINNVSIDHEYVLCYGNRLRGCIRDASQYLNPDNDSRGDWTSANMVGLATERERPNLHYDLINPETGINYGRPLKGWRYDSNTMSTLINEKRILWPPTPDGRPRKKQFISELSAEFTGYSSIIGNGCFTSSGTKEQMQIFGDAQFAFPKCTELLDELLEQATTKDSIILDSFAGTGTTAHAALRLNQKDRGNRKFILVEMEDYAEATTAERVKRVISGYEYTGTQETEIYSKKLTVSNLKDSLKLLEEAQNVADERKSEFDKIGKPVIKDDSLKVIGTKIFKERMEGTGGDFSFYELGERLLLGNGNLNERVGTEKIREYVWFMETKSPLPNGDKKDNEYFLGINLETAYYFYYERERATTLNHAFLKTVKVKAGGYVIYADINTLSQAEMKKFGIVFKKIPRDIAKL